MKVEVINLSPNGLVLANELRDGIVNLLQQSLRSTKKTYQVLVTTGAVSYPTLEPTVTLMLRENTVLFSPVRSIEAAGPCPTCILKAYDRNHATRHRRSCVPPGGMARDLSPLEIKFISALIAKQIVKYQEESASQDVVVFDCNRWAVCMEKVWRDPDCATCWPLQNDKPTRPVFRRRPKRNLNSFRQVDLFRRSLWRPPTGKYLGLARNIGNAGNIPIALASAEMSLNQCRIELGLGKGESFAKSMDIAVLELLERRAGHQPLRSRSNVYKKYAEVSHIAPDPLSYILHDPEYYLDLSSNVTPFQNDRNYLWTWGFSFREQRPVLVPHQLVYYGIKRPPEDLFCIEISNGCAIGSSIEEATLHAILEIIERDSFLMAWYANLDLKEIVAESLPNTLVALICRTQIVFNVRIRLFDATSELGVPTVWAIATTQDGGCVSAAGAHVSAALAADGALRELCPAIAATVGRFKDDPERAVRLYRGVEPAQRMEDHALMYIVPGAIERVPMCREGTTMIHFDELPKPRVAFDLLSDLQSLLSRVMGAGLDVLLVDQTPSQHSKGLSVVKVLIPGMLPMTFGSSRRRVAGSDRLATRIIGEINPLPHPFP
ncbi:YcaO-like family protein [Rhizobium ruizarguesonis]